MERSVIVDFNRKNRKGALRTKSALLTAVLALNAAGAQEAFKPSDDVTRVATSWLKLRAEGELPGLAQDSKIESLNVAPLVDSHRKEWFKDMAQDVSDCRQVVLVDVEMRNAKLKYLYCAEHSFDRPVASYLFNGVTWDRILEPGTGWRDVRTTDAEGYKYIFNGEDLTGWRGDKELWSVAGGVLTGRIRSGTGNQGVNSFLIWTNGMPGDFELSVQFRTPTGGDRVYVNSGIQYRSEVLDAAKWVVAGYQADLEAGTNYTGVLYDQGGLLGGRQILASRGEKVIWDKACKKSDVGSLGSADGLLNVVTNGAWNQYVIRAQGNHLQHFINGKQMVDVTDDCPSGRQSGVIALQIQGDRRMTVQFREIRLKPLP